MFKKIMLFTFSNCFFNIVVFPQQSGFEPNMTGVIKVFDASGKAFINPNIDVAGSPFFKDAWHSGIITISNNGTPVKMSVRLNMQTNQVHCFSKQNIEITLPGGLVTNLLLSDSSQIPVAQYHFQAGFPAVDDQDEKFLYQLLSDGKVKFLKSTIKRVITEKNELSGEINRELRTYDSYYLAAGGKIQGLKKDKNFFLDFFSDKKGEIEQYLKTSKISLKSPGDIQTLVDYYNSLK